VFLVRCVLAQFLLLLLVPRNVHKDIIALTMPLQLMLHNVLLVLFAPQEPLKVLMAPITCADQELTANLVLIQRKIVPLEPIQKVMELQAFKIVSVVLKVSIAHPQDKVFHQ